VASVGARSPPARRTLRNVRAGPRKTRRLAECSGAAVPVDVRMCVCVCAYVHTQSRDYLSNQTQILCTHIEISPPTHAERQPPGFSPVRSVAAWVVLRQFGLASLSRRRRSCATPGPALLLVQDNHLERWQTNSSRGPRRVSRFHHGHAPQSTTHHRRDARRRRLRRELSRGKLSPPSLPPRFPALIRPTGAAEARPDANILGVA